MKTIKRNLGYSIGNTLAGLALCLISIQSWATCYDLSNQTVPTYFAPGDVFPFADGNVEVHYLRDAFANRLNFNTVAVKGAQIAGGIGPELQVSSGRLLIRLNSLASEISFDIANNSGGSQLVNIGVNSDNIAYLNGIEGTNGLVLGDPLIGTAEVMIAPLTPIPGGNWSNGQIRFVARTGGIENVVLGGVTHRYDNLCVFP